MFADVTNEPPLAGNDAVDAVFAVVAVVAVAALPVVFWFQVGTVPVRLAYVYPVQLVRVPDVGVPRVGVTNVGDVLHTITPVPVVPVTAPAPFAKPTVGEVVPVTVTGNAALTAVTPPPLPPAGVAHVPSPRQKVVADALVPLFKFVTGKLPVT